MGEIFKTYDIRGKYPEEIDEDFAYRLGRAFVVFLKAKEVVVGMDMRASSIELKASLMRGITDQGADAIDLGRCSSDSFYFAVNRHKKKAGIIVTPSHLGKEFNGFKLVKAKAVPVYMGNGLEKIKTLLEKSKFSEPKQKGKFRVLDGTINEFVEHIISLVPVDEIKPFKVVVDAGSGMAGDIAPLFFEHLKCRMIGMNMIPDGSFPEHDANPMKEENRKDCSDKVIAKNADIGVLYDGDTDRAAFLDEKGRYVNGDLIIAVVARMMLKKKKTPIVYDLRAGWFAKETIEKNRGKPVLSAVGHPHIKEMMRKKKAPFGGELSGHYYYEIEGGYFECSYLTMLYILLLMSKENKKLSELLEGSGDFFQTGEINVEVKDRQAVLRKIEKKYSDGKMMKLDGISVEYDDWHFNVRASVTEPVLRVTLEATSEKLMKEKKKELLGLIGGKVE